MLEETLWISCFCSSKMLLFFSLAVNVKSQQSKQSQSTKTPKFESILGLRDYYNRTNMLCHPSMAVKTKWKETVLLIAIYDIMAACVSTGKTRAFFLKNNCTFL